MPAFRLSLAVFATLLSAGPAVAQTALTGKSRVDRFGDPLPAGALFRIGTTRLQHGAEVRALAASPDGKLLAAVSNDGSLSLWGQRPDRQASAAGVRPRQQASRPLDRRPGH